MVVLRFSVAQSYQVEMFKAGRTVPATATAEFVPEELSADDREAILSVTTIKPDGTLQLNVNAAVGLQGYFTSQHTDMATLPAHDTGTALLAIRERARTLTELTARKQADHVAKQQKEQELAENYLAGKVLTDPRALANSPLLSNEMRDKVRAEIKRRADEDRAAKELAEAQKAAAEAQKKAALAAWVDEHGSELVRLRKAENQNWVKLAQDEYALSVCPQGWRIPREEGFVQNEWEYTDAYELKNASLEQLQTLLTIREANPQIERLSIYREKWWNERYEESLHKDVLAGCVTTPNAVQVMVEVELS